MTGLIFIFLVVAFIYVKNTDNEKVSNFYNSLKNKISKWFEDFDVDPSETEPTHSPSSYVGMPFEQIQDSIKKEEFNDYYIKNCPLLIEKFYLLNVIADNKSLINITFKNIGGADILAFGISIKAYDAEGELIKEIQGINYTHVKFNFEGIYANGIKIKIDSADVKKVTIRLNKIVFISLDVQNFNEDFVPVKEGEDLKEVYSQVEQNDLYNKPKQQAIDIYENSELNYKEETFAKKVVNKVDEIIENRHEIVEDIKGKFCDIKKKIFKEHDKQTIRRRKQFKEFVGAGMFFLLVVVVVVLVWFV